MVSAFSFLSGNTARAVRLADSMIQIDPLAPLPSHLRAEALLWGGRYAEALTQKAAANKLDPTVVLVESTEGHALRELGRLDESLAAFLDFTNKNDLPSFGLAMTYGRMERRDDGLRVIRDMEARSRRQWVDPDLIGAAYAGIGDKDHAMEWLNKAFQAKSYFLRLAMNWDMPWLRTMQSDPRYVALKQKVLATKFSE